MTTPLANPMRSSDSVAAPLLTMIPAFSTRYRATALGGGSSSGSMPAART